MSIYSIYPKIVRIVATLALVLLMAAPAIAEEQPVISDIEVRGLSRMDVGSIFSRLSQTPGTPIDTEKVTEDIKAIFSMGYFDDVSAELVVEEGGLKLVYILKEKPTIRRVDFYGNKEVSDEKIDNIVNISHGAMYDRVLITETAQTIGMLLAVEGYPRARVVPVLREVSESHLLLTYYIEEGPEIRIDEITFKGNEAYSDRQLRGKMKTSEWWFMSWLGNSGYLKRDKLEMDRFNLEEHYQNNGYIKTVVHEPVITYEEGFEWLDIAITVEEGPRYKVGEIYFSGSELYAQEEYRAAVKVVPGQYVDRSVLREDVEELTQMLSRKGYALATVYPGFSINEAEGLVNIEFRMNEGDRYRVGRIEIHGNNKTRDKVIRREFRLNEGDVFDSDQTDKTQRALTNLNFFGNLKVDPRPDDRTKTLDMIVEVEEKLTGSFNIGGGYSSIDKLMAMVDLTFGNLGGRGQYLKVLSRISSVSTTYEIEFRDPWFLDRPVSFSTSVYRTTREYDDYDTYTEGFSLGLGKRFWEYWAAGATYRFSQTTIENISATASSITRSQEGTKVTSSISPYLARDTRDNYMVPHEGSRHRLNFTYAGLGGDNNYFKWTMESQFVLPVTKRSELSLRGRYGYGIGLDDDPLPLYERFRVGSSSTVRGLRNVGPRDEFGNYIGGGQRIIFNGDYTYSASASGMFKWLLFYDAGTAFDREINLRYTAGAGFKWFSPIGPISLAWANNLYPWAGEPTYRWEFSVGSMF